jgi:hypothetical protein
MAMVVEINLEKEFIRVRLTGEFSLAEAKDALVRMFEAVAAHKATRVLVDCRDIKGKMTVMDHFEYSTFGAQELHKAFSKGVSTSTRLAYVSKPPLFDSNSKFGETVAVNRGVNVLTTDSMEEALKWLEIDRKNGVEELRP